METNFEHYYSTPEKIVEYVGCHCDCFECIYPATIPCNLEFSSTDEQIFQWLNSEYKEEVEQ